MSRAEKRQMSPAEQALSYETVKFVDRWLMREFPHGWDALREAMLRLIATDEPYWITRNLWHAYDEALKTTH
jgi:hypothetical protein